MDCEGSVAQLSIGSVNYENLSSVQAKIQTEVKVYVLVNCLMLFFQTYQFLNYLSSTGLCT